MRARGPKRRLRDPWPLRLRLTVAVTAVTAVVLATVGVLVFAEFQRGLDDRTDFELRERAAALTKLARDASGDRLLGFSGESLAQVFGPSGQLRNSTRALDRVPLLTPAEVGSARRGQSFFTHDAVRGTGDGARVLAFPLGGGGVAAIAEARDRREVELARLGGLLAVGLFAALVLVAFTGYQVAGAALRPVERIRAQAASIGSSTPRGRLPEPGTDDELDRLTRTLNDLLGRLAAALERERRIVSDASHELRTPISVLRTRLDVALRGQHEPSELEAVLHEARADVGGLARMADDLLVLARADQGRLPLRPEPIDVQDLLEATARRHAAAAATAGQALEVTVAVPGGAVVLADPDRLAQALDNLVINALSYGAGAIELIARAAGVETVELAVADHGPGFAEELLPRAFERFAQGTEDGRGDGAGLGLAIVAAVATALGGSARAANRPGGGAEVTLTVPAA